MVSVEASMHRILSGNEEARRVLYLNNSMHPPSHLSMAAPCESALTYRRAPMSYSSVQQYPQQSHNNKRPAFTGQSSSGPSTAVSRRNARERKRVRLVNLGFSTLRERVPPGAKNKKLSKVETLRAAIEYIRQLQEMLGHTDQQMYDDSQNFQRLIEDENFGVDECSSAASSEEVATPLRGSCGPAGGSGDLSPASSHPSDYSLVSSPYTNQSSQEDHILDMGMWFS